MKPKPFDHLIQRDGESYWRGPGSQEDPVAATPEMSHELRPHSKARVVWGLSTGEMLLSTAGGIRVGTLTPHLLPV